MEKMGIEQYLLMDHASYKNTMINNMIKTKEEQWKERRDYDTWHSNYMDLLKQKILEEMNKGTEYIAIDNEILEELFTQEDEK